MMSNTYRSYCGSRSQTWSFADTASYVIQRGSGCRVMDAECRNAEYGCGGAECAGRAAGQQGSGAGINLVPGDCMSSARNDGQLGLGLGVRNGPSRDNDSNVRYTYGIRATCSAFNASQLAASTVSPVQYPASSSKGDPKPGYPLSTAASNCQRTFPLPSPRAVTAVVGTWPPCNCTSLRLPSCPSSLSPRGPDIGLPQGWHPANPHTPLRKILHVISYTPLLLLFLLVFISKPAGNRYVTGLGSFEKEKWQFLEQATPLPRSPRLTRGAASSLGRY